MNENNDDGGSKIALSHDKDAFYMYIDQWRRQRGADGARAPPFVFHQLQTSLNHLICQSFLHCTACVVTRMMSFNGNVGRAIYCACLLLMKKIMMTFFLGKIPSYLAPALALLNGFEPYPSQNPGYATVDLRDSTTIIIHE